jgi:hypothetical protein
MWPSDADFQDAVQPDLADARPDPDWLSASSPVG